MFVTISINDAELDAVLEMMRMTGSTTPGAVVHQALYRLSRHLEMGLPISAFDPYHPHQPRTASALHPDQQETD
jgi:hypothetical protein